MLALIPARGGSKGLPNKNIMLFNGLPLIAHTIIAAIESEKVSQIVISTDSEEIATVAREYNVRIPFMRPDILAQDDSIANDAYIYTIDRLNIEFKESYKEFVILQPTSPLRISKDIDNAIKLFHEKRADSVISCTELAHPPLWALTLDKNNEVKPYFETDALELNRQDIIPAFSPNGAIAVLNYAIFKASSSFFSKNTFGYQMPTDRSVDIDTLQDFQYAEMIANKICAI